MRARHGRGQPPAAKSARARRARAQREREAPYVIRAKAQLSRGSEVELGPGGPPVGRARDERMVVKLGDALAVAVLDKARRRMELDLDLGGAAGIPRRNGLQVLERLLRASLDQLA